MMKRSKPLFGTAGNSEDFYAQGFKSTVQAPAYLRQMGLDAFEYSCGRGVTLRTETAQKIAQAAGENDVTLSVHAPYFTNLCASESEKQENTLRWLRESARAVTDLGGTRVIFHPGALTKQDRTKARENALSMMRRVSERIGEEYPNVLLCPETLGKRNSYGTLEEVLELCALCPENTLPCIDFAHLHAAGCGCLNTAEDFETILLRSIEVLGRERMECFHVHFSHIEFTAAGEKKHRVFGEDGFGPDFALLAPILQKYGLFPTIICESAGTQARDAAEMQKIYEEIEKTRG